MAAQVFDMWGTVMLTKPDTTAYGLGWAWDGTYVRAPDNILGCRFHHEPGHTDRPMTRPPTHPDPAARQG